jgi:hypothetical protein
MTAADLIRVCLELDQQVICPRPSCWGQAAEMVSKLACVCENAGQTFNPPIYGDYRTIDLSVIRKRAPCVLEHPQLDRWEAEQREAVGEQVWAEFNACKSQRDALLAACKHTRASLFHSGVLLPDQLEVEIQDLCGKLDAVLALARGEANPS